MSERTKFKRILFTGDWHCGSRYGLTPTRYHSTWSDKLATRQAELWNWWIQRVIELKPDIMVINGDAVDGQGKRGDNTECITTDLLEQADIATEIIRATRIKRVLMTYGTSFHVAATGSDIEDVIAGAVGADIAGHQWLDVNGCVFSVRHHVGTSSIPHGRHTAISRARLWNILHVDRGNQPKADVLVRSHVHFHSIAGGVDWLAMTLPCCQMGGTRYGRKFDGVMDYGFVHFDVDTQGGYAWQAHILNPKSAEARVLTL